MANSGTSNSGVPAPAGFTSAVDSAIMSSTDTNLGAYSVHSFASAVDSAIRSTTDTNMGASHVHSFASRVDNAIKSISPKEMLDATGYVGGFQLFTLDELEAATDNFSLDNKIGAGSFGCVYRGKLVDGREVAIKRGRTWSKRKSEIKYELAFLSRLRHEHLVGLVGLCEEKDERLLVYEYMKNGALYDHLHDKGSSVLNSWKMRIKIALDASRGIQYIHNYAVPYIHRDIKSSNILLDATWTARVSDFGLSFVKKTAGTVGYIDPVNYDQNEWTEKSDVYGLGVVLLELLTGKTAIFNSGEDGGTPLRVVDFAVPAIWAGDLLKILDPRVGPPDVNEAEAVELVAYTAIRCVNWKGKDRPTMVDIVVNLERALAICHRSHDSISSCTIPVLAICDSSQDSIFSGAIPVVLHTKRKKKILCCF